MSDVNYLSELFYSPEIWGYFGPLAFIVIGYFVAVKNKMLGFLWYIVCLLMAYTYFDMLATQPNLIWNALILIFGGGLACMTPILFND